MTSPLASLGAQPAPSQSRPVPNAALDGIRAFAIAGVVAYHARLIVYPGGIFGVDLFFVLSGFLVTGILLRGWQRRGTVAIGDFYRRRARRLLPALIALLLGYLLVSQLLQLRSLTDALTESFRALTGSYNWYRMLRIKPYEDLGHLWSLAIEFQFCLIWPVFIAVALRFGKSLSSLAYTCAGVIVGVTLWRWYLIETGERWHRIYFGTDLRLDAFAAGALLQVIMMHGSVAADGYRQGLARYATLVGVIGVAIHLALAATTTLLEHTNFPWIPPLLLLSCMLIIAALSGGIGSRFARFFTLYPFPQLGRASYGIYLWHYLFQRMVPRSVGAELKDVIVIAGAIVCGLLSFHLIEKRFLGKRGASASE